MEKPFGGRHLKPAAFRWLAVAVVAAALLGSAVRATDVVKLFEHLEALAQQRYGRTPAALVRDWGRLVQDGQALADAERLNRTNAFFNRRLYFEDDPVVWRQEDYWATPLEFIGKSQGDCEDYVIAKYKTLVLMGVPKDKLRLVYVRAAIERNPPVAHMVLGYYAEPGAEPLILDNLTGAVRPASQRTDLQPVYSFNEQGLWVGNATTSAADPTVRLSKWRDLLQRMRDDGLPP